MPLSPECTDGHMRVTDGEEYDEAWAGKYVVEMCGYWNSWRMTYARPPFVEMGMGANIGRVFDAVNEAYAAIEDVRSWY